MRTVLALWAAAAMLLYGLMHSLFTSGRRVSRVLYTGEDVDAFPCASTLPISAVALGTCGWFKCSVDAASDPNAGPWIRVSQPIDTYSAKRIGGHKSLWRSTHHIYYRRTRSKRFLVDVRAAREPPGDDWVMAVVISDGVHLYTRSGTQDGITAIALVYGDNAPLARFTDAGLISSEPRVALAARRSSDCPRQSLSFRDNGTFKIMQLADLHFSVDEHTCRDVPDVSHCHSHTDTIAAISGWLDSEKPDMVVFTGDQLNGQRSSWDERSTLPLWLELVVDRQIPWAAVLGNHDSESGFMTRREQVALLARYPYSVTQVGPAINGAGNFDVPLVINGTEAFTLWFLDSGAHPRPNLLRPLESLRYDWVRTDQITWLEHGQAQRQRPGMLFVHIPVPEAFSRVDRDKRGRAMKQGVRLERFHRLGAQARAGLFDAVARTRRAAAGIRVIVHGHMHNNADCRRIRGVWICFGGGTSYAAYGLVGLERRCRVYHIEKFGERITSWQRIPNDKRRIDEVELVP